MKTLLATSALLFSMSTVAATDAEMCQQYGRDLASNSTEQQSTFLKHLTTQSASGAWTLSMEECNVYIQRGKHDYNFDVEDMMSDD
ncbi:hypothetical protein [Vibrio agarivorans]|uniref:hypothetical protein n=1 Tax=Vibrio agarivorans TaxID=153622 RepID=UPI00222E3718|nr:hypothetical protein [Vibrio agarivorans]MDN3659637.1 hypothetical protein [Vibrio agarivorans]